MNRPKTKLILLHVLNAAILNWRAVAYGMRLDITTGLMGSQEQRCSHTAWQMDSGTGLQCLLVHPTFCSMWTATGKKIHCFISLKTLSAYCPRITLQKAFKESP